MLLYYLTKKTFIEFVCDKMIIYCLLNKFILAISYVTFSKILRTILISLDCTHFGLGLDRTGDVDDVENLGKMRFFNDKDVQVLFSSTHLDIWFGLLEAKKSRY